jgi:hypothetical protein
VSYRLDVTRPDGSVFTYDDPNGPFVSPTHAALMIGRVYREEGCGNRISFAELKRVMSEVASASPGTPMKHHALSYTFTVQPV